MRPQATNPIPDEDLQRKSPIPKPYDKPKPSS